MFKAYIVYMEYGYIRLPREYIIIVIKSKYNKDASCNYFIIIFFLFLCNKYIMRFRFECLKYKCTN